MRLRPTIAAIFLLFLGSGASKAFPADSLHFVQLDSLMDRYVEAMMPLDNDQKAKECEFIISSCSDSATRSHVALRLFDKYRNSPLMGEEEVAIRIYDKWFATRVIPMRSEFDELDADLFVRFNRNSLIGMDAPQLSLFKPCGGRESVPRKGRSTLLFFYDSSCSKCRAEVGLLPAALGKVDFKLELLAVYTGTSRKAWRDFRRSIRSPGRNVRVRHYWDPEIKSGYQLLYGVISTPKMYFIEPGGTIIGRRLEMNDLATLLPYAAILDKYYSDRTAATSRPDRKR